MWSKLIGGFSGYSSGLTITESDDSSRVIYIGGYTVAFGITNLGDAFVIKLTSNGDLQWIKLFGGAAFNELRSIIIQEDGSLVCTGQTLGYGEGGYDIMLLKLSSDGDLEWAKTFGTP